MQIAEIITPDRVCWDVEAASKKRVLEILSERITRGNSAVQANDVFDCLLARERLGSTALGEGVALPHGRVAALRTPLGAFMRVVEGIDFDSPDGQPVDLVFGLLVPEESTEEHLQILAQLAEFFSDESLRASLRQLGSAAEAFDLLTRFVPGEPGLGS